MVKCPVGQRAIQALLFVNLYVFISFSTRAAYFLFLVTNCDLFVSSDHLSESAIWSTDPYYLQWSCSPLTGRVTEEWLQNKLYGSDQNWCMLWLSRLWYRYYYCNKVWHCFINDEPSWSANICKCILFKIINIYFMRLYRNLFVIFGYFLGAFNPVEYAKKRWGGPD